MIVSPPAGYALVPVEPTLGMIAALLSWAEENEAAKLLVAQWMLGSFQEDYQAMLAAAPNHD